MKTIRKYFWYVPALVWMYVIFNFSGQTGDVSGSLSLAVTEKIVDIIEIARGGDEADAQHLTSLLHPVVRKGAHMAEYAVLCILLFLSFMASFLATRSMAVSAVVSFLYACLDEFHQSFVDERAGQFMDVCVDMTGVLAAIVVLLFIYSAWQARRES